MLLFPLVSYYRLAPADTVPFSTKPHRINGYRDIGGKEKAAA
jgi:hypothetical protein